MMRCMGCMEEREAIEGSCPLCGYVEEENDAQFLSIESVLQGNYLVGKVIGRGGFGITYIGWDMASQRKVAIKEYCPSEYAVRSQDGKYITVLDGGAVERYREGLRAFFDEGEKLAKVQHVEGVVRLFGSFTENDTAYLVMEHLDGDSVGHIVRQIGKYPYQEAKEVMGKVLLILASIHEEGLLHLDVSPGNIFVTPNNQIKLIDFGAARYAGSDFGVNSSILLKPGFAPLEQYHDQEEQGTWSDVYATGATFYYMITGVRPIGAINRMTKDILKKPSKLGVKIPKREERALMKSLAVTKEERIKNAYDFIKRLEGRASIGKWFSRH